MRVAMGLALNEIDREARAIEFYEILSSFDFMSSTPTLFNSGTLHSQLSSCYLTTVSDDLEGIYDAIKENALLAKRSEEHTSELQSLMRISYAVFCLKKKQKIKHNTIHIS